MPRAPEKPEFQEGGGEVGDMDRAPGVVGEEDSGLQAGREVVHSALVLGLTAPMIKHCFSDLLT